MSIESEMIKDTIIATVEDLASNFLYYDRKEDEQLSADQLKNAVCEGKITIDEIVAEFRKHLENSL